MSKELSSESNISDLVDYLIEKSVDIHISMPDYCSSSLRIKADCTLAWGKQIRCIKCIDMIRYRSAVPEVRNMIVTQTIHELVEELDRLR